jgi:acetaldehyde dehydrogenase/alcohol dehydrogenase
LEDDRSGGIRKIAEPIRIIVGVIPVTNPTSTTIFKALLALKTRNTIIFFCPHPKARRCTIAAARLMHNAAVEAGALADVIAWLEDSNRAEVQRLLTARVFTRWSQTPASARSVGAWRSSGFSSPM